MNMINFTLYRDIGMINVRYKGRNNRRQGVSTKTCEQLDKWKYEEGSVLR